MAGSGISHDYAYHPGPPPGHEQPAVDDLTEAVEKGKRCDSKGIYCVPTDEDPNKYHWVDEKPLQYGADGDKSKTKKAREAFAVNVYHKFNGIKYEWYVGEVRINSTLLHEALETILEGYPGLTQHELKSFPPPFLPFIHRWQAMLSYTEKLPSSELKLHLQLLEDVLAPLLKGSFDTIRDVEKTGHVAFIDLALVLEKETDSVGMVRNCHLMRTPCKPAFWQIGVDVVDWDGRRCGLLAQLGHMFEYQGLRALTALEVSPPDGLPNQQSIRKRLIARGRNWEELRGHFFKAFSDQHEERVNERMVIHARAYHKYETEFPNYAKLSEIGQLTWAQSMNRYSSIVPSAPGSPMQVDLTPMTDEECLIDSPLRQVLQHREEEVGETRRNQDARDPLG
jgi:hypothetical protein